MLRVCLSIHLAALGLAERLRSRLGPRDDRGQSTAEYALVLLGAAGVALLLIGWARSTDKIGGLLNSVIDRVLGNVG